MGVLIRWAEVLGQKVGSLQAPGTRNAEFVRRFICSVYQAHPSRFKGNLGIKEAYVKGWMRSVCGDALPPPPPQTNECIRQEQAWGTYKSAYNTPEGACGTTHYWRSIEVYVEGEVVNYAPYVDSNKWYIRRKNGIPIGIAGVAKSIYDQKLFGPAPNFPLPNISLPATCTNAPNGTGGYDAGWVESSYNKIIPEYCDAGGVYSPTTPPPVINKTYDIKISPDYSSRVTYTIKPDIDGNFTFPIEVTDGNNNITIDFGGITIDLPGSDPYPPSGDGNNNLPPEVIIKPPPRINGDNYEPVAPEEEPPPEGEEEIEEKDVVIAFIKVDIVTPPVKGKTILQKSENDNDYFAGYFCWLVEADGEYRLTQEPIRKKKQIFIPPQYVTGYTMYAVNGAKLKATRYISKQQ